MANSETTEARMNWIWSIRLFLAEGQTAWLLLISKTITTKTVSYMYSRNSKKQKHWRSSSEGLMQLWLRVFVRLSKIIPALFFDHSYARVYREYPRHPVRVYKWVLPSATGAVKTWVEWREADWSEREECYKGRPKLRQRIRIWEWRIRESWRE